MTSSLAYKLASDHVRALCQLLEEIRDVARETLPTTSLTLGLVDDALDTLESKVIELTNTRPGSLHSIRLFVEVARASELTSCTLRRAPELDRDVAEPLRQLLDRLEKLARESAAVAVNVAAPAMGMA